MLRAHTFYEPLPQLPLFGAQPPTGTGLTKGVVSQISKKELNNKPPAGIAAQVRE